MDKTKGMLLNSVIGTLKAQTLVIKTISCELDEETAKKNRALDFICSKGLACEFTNKNKETGGNIFTACFLL